MENVRDKVIAITGASSGIGRATALKLAAGGAKLVLGARREDGLLAVAGEIDDAGGTAVVRALDVRDPASVRNFVEHGLDVFGRLDVLVNNAGIGPISLLDDLEVKDWEAMVDVNLKGALHALAAVLPVFRRQESGHLVNVVSVAGMAGVSPRMAVYAATKNAVRTLGEGLRVEAGPNLRVTNVSPGFVRTNFASSMSDAGTRAVIEARMSEIGLPPEAIADVIAFAIAQPASVEIGDIAVRPTAQD